MVFPVLFSAPLERNFSIMVDTSTGFVCLYKFYIEITGGVCQIDTYYLNPKHKFRLFVSLEACGGRIHVFNNLHCRWDRLKVQSIDNHACEAYTYCDYDPKRNYASRQSTVLHLFIVTKHLSWVEEITRFKHVFQFSQNIHRIRINYYENLWIFYKIKILKTVFFTTNLNFCIIK